ncbi:MAG: sulfatase-like hydrolase/transferase [Pseudomonadota bacterium]
MTNLLILMADEMRRDGLSAYGGPIETPALDALAARGAVFEAAYTPSPMCVPARAAIATGLPIHATGHWDSAAPYDGAPRSWMQALTAAGVETASIGKLHFRRVGCSGFAREIRPMHVLDGLGWTLGLLRDGSTRYDTSELAAEVGYGWTETTRYDASVTEAAWAWLAEPRSGPWAVFVSYVSPHYPLIAPPDYADLIDPQTLAPPIPGRLDHPEIARLLHFFDYDRHFQDEAGAKARAAYFALCRFIDDQVAAVLETLAATGQAEETMVVFCSDHGEMLGDHGFWTKQVMYEGSVGVPLIAAGPGIKPRRVATPASLLDLYPTALAVAGLPPDDRPGAPLMALAAAPDDPDRTVISEYHDGGSSTGAFMIRWDRWKYVHYAGERPQLFDRIADPEERKDLGLAHPAADEGLHRLRVLCDPEAISAAAFADQAARIAALGGPEACRARSFGHTPIPVSS